jgi:hypothetical protein
MRARALAVLFAAAILVPSAFASASASEARSGDLHATKNCRGFTGDVGSYCLIVTSNLPQIAVGSRINYLQPASLLTPAGSDVVLDPPGPGNNAAFGNCSLAVGRCTFWGGTGTFTHFHANVAVTPLGGYDWAWDGTYSFSPTG